MPAKIPRICDRIIEYSFYALFFFVPLVLTPWNFELFEYNKMMLTYALTIIIVGAWLVKMVAAKKFKIQRTPLDIPLLLFVASQILSTIFSIDRHTSIWGYYSRFHQGLLATFSYVILFYALVSNLDKKSTALRLIFVALISGFVVAIYGIAEHFGIDAKYWVQDVKNRVFSTLGQPNWLAAYLAILTPITVAFVLQIPTLSSPIKRLRELRIMNRELKNLPFLSSLFLILTSLFYLTLLYTKSRSGFAGFWIGNIAFWIVLFFQFRKKFLKWFIILNFAFLILTFLAGSPFDQVNKFFSASTLQQKITSPRAKNGPTPANIAPAGPALETGGTESGEIRKIVWKGALDIWRHYPIFGSGVETFAYSYYQYRPKEHNLVSEWDFLYNKAHNEYLNFLATTGVFGLGTYLLLTGWFLFITFKYLISNIYDLQLKSQKPSIIDNKYYLIILAFLAGYISILVSNFFGFSVVIIGIFFFLIPAFVFTLAEALDPQKTWSINFSKPQITIDDAKNPNPSNRLTAVPLNLRQWVTIATILLATCYLLFSLGRMWLADKSYAAGYNDIKINEYPKAYESLKEAINLNGGEPTYRSDLSQVEAVLSMAALQENQATLSAYLLNEALKESQKVIDQSPKNVNFWKTRTKVFYTFSQYDPKYKDEALKAILEAKKLAPTDAKVGYNLGVLYVNVGKTQEAIKAFEETVNLKPDYRDARYALALIYKEAGEPQKAIAQLEYSLKNIATQDAEAQRLLEDLKK